MEGGFEGWIGTGGVGFLPPAERPSAKGPPAGDPLAGGPLATGPEVSGEPEGEACCCVCIVSRGSPGGPAGESAGGCAEDGLGWLRSEGCSASTEEEGSGSLVLSPPYLSGEREAPIPLLELSSESTIGREQNLPARELIEEAPSKRSRASVNWESASEVLGAGPSRS